MEHAPGSRREALFLALDQGGNSSRALVFDRAGEVRAKAQRVVGTTSPREGRVEQDPEELVQSLRSAVAEAVAALTPRERTALTAAGLATQRSSVVCWDRLTGDALTPVLSWQDLRAARWMRGFEASREEIHRRTGLFPNAHFGAGKLRWCIDEVPAVREALRAGCLAFGPLASFLLFRLLEGNPLWVDRGNASRTLLWNLDEGDWDPHLLELFGLPAAPLPRCVPTSHDFGLLRVGEGTIPMRVVIGDQGAALFAAGPLTGESVYVNIGTGAFVSLPVGSVAPLLPRLLCSLVAWGDEPLFAIEGTVNGAYAALQWAERELETGDCLEALPGWLEERAAPPLFLNGVSGLGAPYWCPDFESAFLGAGELEDKMVAVVESIVFLVQANLDEMVAQMSSVRRIVITGGMARLDGICQRMADLSGLPVFRPKLYEATARGLARLMAGDTGERVAQRGDEFQPRVAERLRERYGRWKVQMEARLTR